MIRANNTFEVDASFTLPDGKLITYVDGSAWRIVLDSVLDTGYNVVFRKGCVIGFNASIWSNTVIDSGAVVGKNTKIHCNCYISQMTLIGENVFIGPGTQILNDRFPMRTDPKSWEPPVIGDDAVIGGGVTILPGVKIGNGAKIGGGSVVTKNVPAGEVWAGNPARKMEKSLWISS